MRPFLKGFVPTLLVGILIHPIAGFTVAAISIVILCTKPEWFTGKK